MAVELTSLELILKMVGTVSNALDLSITQDHIAKDYSKTFNNGTGANQGNMMWHDQRATASNEDLDLAGGLTSAFGAAITFLVVKGILVVASPSNTGNIVISRPANGLVLFAASGDALAGLKPGGVFLWTDPSAAGLTVTGATGDLLNIASSSGTSTYDIWIWGEV